MWKFIYYSQKSDNYKETVYLSGLKVKKHYYENAVERFEKSYFWGIFRRTSDSITKELEQLEFKLKKYKFDDAYYLGSASGETFFIMQYFNQLFKKNNSQKPIFITSHKYTEDIVQMFFPDIRCVYDDTYYRSLWLNANSNDPFITNNHRYFFPFNRQYFTYLEEKHIKGETYHFFDRMVDSLKLNGNKKILPAIGEDFKAKAQNVREQLSKNFVIISKYANSNGSMTDWFWKELEKRLKDLGLDIFYNDKNCGLDLPSYRHLAESAKAVIGVRSGAIDWAINTSPLKIIYYLPFRQRGDVFPPVKSEYVKQNFSIKPMSHCGGDIWEYDVCEYGEYRLLDETIKNIKAIL